MKIETHRTHSLADVLRACGIEEDSISSLQDFVPRKGFQHLIGAEFAAVLDNFEAKAILANFVPILTDGVNYVCVFRDSPLRGAVCCVVSDEASYEPRFSSILSFIEFMATHPECKEIYDLAEYVEDFDLPFKLDDLENMDCRGVELLQEQLINCNDEFERKQIAYSLMAITSLDKVKEVIVPFLEDEDWDVQERAILVIGYLRYLPAVKRLKELSNINSSRNNVSVIKWALSRMDESFI